MCSEQTDSRKVNFLIVLILCELTLLCFTNSFINVLQNSFHDLLTKCHFLVFFSCNVRTDIIQNPKLPVLRYKEDGFLDSSISSRIVGGTPAVSGEFQGKVCTC